MALACEMAFTLVHVCGRDLRARSFTVMHINECGINLVPDTYLSTPEAFLKTVGQYTSRGGLRSVSSSMLRSQPECGMITVFTMSDNPWSMIGFFKSCFHGNIAIRVFHDLSTIQTMSILPTIFWLYYLQLKRPIKSTTLKGNPFTK